MNASNVIYPADTSRSIRIIDLLLKYLVHMIQYRVQLQHASTLGCFFGSFDYTIGFKKSAEHANADGLSRHPVDQTGHILDLEKFAKFNKIFGILPVDWRASSRRSRSDPIISQAIRLTRIGWPETCPV